MFPFDYHLLEGFMLAFIRIATAISLMPVFGYQSVPLQLKAALGFVLALTLAPAAAQQVATAPPGALPMVAAAASEVAIGLVIGAICALILVAAEMAGALIGVQIGFAAATTIDPLFQHESNVLARLQYLLALVIFIALDAHHILITALADSLRQIPLGGFIWQANATPHFARLAADAVDVAMRLAAPTLAVILITEVALGFVARAMPQMNVFFVAFPLKIGVGLLVLAVSLPLFVYLLANSFKHFEAGLFRMIGLLAGR